MSSSYKLKDGREYVIRNAIPEDASNLIKYLNSIAAESDNLTFGPGELTITVGIETKIIENAISSNNQYFVVAELDGLIIGNLNFSAGIKPRIAHIGEFGVSVLKEYWGNKIARELINGLIKWAKDGGKVTKINLQVREDNEKAINLYKKLGFEIEGLIKRSFFIKGKYYNCYHMGKILD